MKIFLPKSGFFVLLFLFIFSGVSIGQCTVSSSTNSSTLSCGSGLLVSCNGIINIGNGVTAINLVMDADLDLTSCGAVQFVVNKATLDFSTANKRLYLAEGSSIVLTNGGTFNPAGGTGGGCTGNDRVYIGGVLLAACQGGAGLLGFDDIISLGGTGNATSNSPVCVGSSINLTATPPPLGTYTYSWSGSGLSATAYSSSANYSLTATTTPVTAGVYTVSMKRASDTKIITASTTVSVLSTPVITSQPTNQLDCEGASVKFKVIASGSGLTYSWQYKRPTDASFITLTGTVANTSYPSTGEIRIDNVGSAQYPDGTQFQVVVSNGNCSVTSNPVTLSVNEITGLTPSATNVTQCYGTNYTYTVTTSHPANVVSYRWKKSIISGVWDEISDGGAYSGATTATLIITGGTPAESAEYRAYITFLSSGADCNVTSTTRNRKITFLPLLTVPVVTIIQPTCVVNTGTITVTVQSATDTYSFDNGANYQSSNVKSGLTVGSYDVIIKNEKLCVSPTANFQIISDTSIWDGTSWINGTPDAGRGIVFEEDFNSVSDINACSCQVTNGANVVINNGHALKVENAVEVSSGTLTFENNASLVQINDAAINTGNINYKRHTKPVKRYDFTYWSSPVVGQTLYNLSPNTLYDKYYGYNGTNWITYYNGSHTMEAGKGYSIRAPQAFDISLATIDTNPVFVGKPNNGLVSFAVAGNLMHLLGNPYPSAIDADKFIAANSSSLEGTLYFWTHNTSPSASIAGNAIYNYTANDYVTYNKTGGVNLASGKIAAGQGFFAPATTGGGTVVFNNSMRLLSGSVIDNSQFYKSSTTAKTIASATNKSRIWLNLTNKEGVFKQTLIGYIPGATNDYDGGFDGVTYDVNQYVDFYSVNQKLNLSIQGRALPFIQKDSVALGYKSTIKGEFQISIDRTDGILASQEVFLEDKELHLLHDLKKEAYKFTTEKGVFNNRFVLRYETDNNAGKIATRVVVAEQQALVSVLNNEIVFHSSEGAIAVISLYDVSGKLLCQKDNVAAANFVVQNLNIAHQVLLVYVVLENEKSIVTKVVY